MASGMSRDSLDRAGRALMLDKGRHLIEEVLLENVLPHPNDVAPLLGVA